MTQTQVVKLPVSEPDILAQQIENECNIRAVVGYWLASSFVAGNLLILIFQKIKQ